MSGGDTSIVITQSISVGSITVPSGYTVSAVASTAPIDSAQLTIRGTLTNYGKYAGFIDDYVDIKNTGEMTFPSGHQKILNNFGRIENSGLLHMSIHNSGSIDNQNGGEISGVSNMEYGTITNHGLIGVNENAGVVSNHGTARLSMSNNSGTLSNSRTLSFYCYNNSGIIDNYGTMNIEEYLYNTGAINNYGTLPLYSTAEPWIARYLNFGSALCCYPFYPWTASSWWTNARFHRKTVLARMAAQVIFHLLFLPPYSPDLNPIEQFWAWLKRRLRKLLPLFPSFDGALMDCLILRDYTWRPLQRHQRGAPQRKPVRPLLESAGCGILPLARNLYGAVHAGAVAYFSD